MRYAFPIEREWAVVLIQTVNGKPVVTVLDYPKNGVLAREIREDGDDQTDLFQQVIPALDGTWHVEYTIRWLPTGELVVDECSWSQSAARS